jgi:hypothetical protein
VARPEPERRLATSREQRRDDEAEAALSEGDGGLERAPEAFEHRLARLAEPRLLIEVIDRHEPARSRAVTRQPVVAATSDRRVLESFDVEAPAAGQSTDQRAGVEVIRQRPHYEPSRMEPSSAIVQNGLWAISHG